MDLESVTAQLMREWKDHEVAFGDDMDMDSLPSSSPEPSVDSACSSPEMCFSSGGSGHNMDAKDFSHGCTAGRKAAGRLKQSKSKMSIKRRMKASEREKMRMRSLAEALHQLRDYLPPDYSKRGQPLTKIQTLKSTIEYINVLSDILATASRNS